MPVPIQDRAQLQALLLAFYRTYDDLYERFAEAEEDGCVIDGESLETRQIKVLDVYADYILGVRATQPPLQPGD
jgi:hypothetical protein